MAWSLFEHVRLSGVSTIWISFRPTVLQPLRAQPPPKGSTAALPRPDQVSELLKVDTLVAACQCMAGCRADPSNILGVG
jgi:hypothetical protein